METLTIDAVVMYLTISAVVGGLVIKVAKTLSEHGVKLEAVEHGQDLILKSLDKIIRHGEDIAAMKSDIASIYKRMDRDIK